MVEDIAPEEGMRRLSDPACADAMREAQKTLDRELSGPRASRREPAGRQVTYSTNGISILVCVL